VLPQLTCTREGVVTPIRIVLTAKTGILTLYTKEGVELLCFLPYTIGSKDKMCMQSINSHRLISSMVKRSRAILQCSQSDQTVKVTVKIS